MSQILAIWFLFGLVVHDLEPAHATNAVFCDLLRDGINLGGTKASFPPPRLRAGQTEAEQHQVLAELAGGERALRELLRDSVTAPFLLKVRDSETKSGDTIRYADLVFAIHAKLSDIHPADAARQAAGKATDVANMRIETTLLTSEALESRKIPPVNPDQEWYAHLSARLLDRIQVEATDHIVVTGTKESLILASRSDSRFGVDGPAPNFWNTIGKDGKPSSKPQPYEGGASYTKISRLQGAKDILVVESHFVFIEPKAWFDGAPILRSKFSPIAQDQIRRLRRDVKSAGR